MAASNAAVINPFTIIAVAILKAAPVFLQVPVILTGMERYHGSMGRSGWLVQRCSLLVRLLAGLLGGVVGFL